MSSLPQSRHEAQDMRRHSLEEPEITKQTNESLHEKSGSEGAPKDSSGEKEEEEWEYVTGFKLYSVIGAVTVSAFIMLLDISIVTTAIPRITSEFHSLQDVGWYGSSYLLASSSLQPLTGKLYSQFSSKWTFIFFTVLFEVGSLLCGVSQSSNMLIVGRAVAGMGGAGLMNGGLTIISACVPLQQRATYIGFLMACAQLGVLFGPLIGGALTEHATWRWCFYINLPAGAVVLGILFLIHIPDRTATSGIKGSYKEILNSLDLPGFALFAPTSIMFLLALEWGGTEYSWGSATVIGLFCGSFGNLLIFLAWEYKRGDSAMIPLYMLRNRIVWASCIYIFFFFGALIIISYYLAIWFQAIKGITPTLSGVYLLPSIMPQMLFAIVSGVLVGKLGYYLPFAVFSGIGASIGNGLISSFTPSTSTSKWVGYQIILGLARGAGFQQPIIAVQNCLPESKSPVALSILVFFQTLGGAVFISFAQTAFTIGLSSSLTKYAPNVTSQTVLTAGATHFREAVGEGNVLGTVKAYNEALQHVFYIAAGCSAATFVFSWGMGWKSIKKEKKVDVSPDA